MNGKISNIMQIASLRRYTLTEGAGTGLDVIDCDNGNIRFLINVSKACDIMQLYHQGQNMSFVSKNGFTKREVPFINRFEGGMIYTCGLDSVGGREGYELHGTVHNTPAEIIRADVNEDRIVVEALVRNTALFGQNLLLKRTISSAIGSDSVCVEDELCNLGFEAADYCLLYHINVGYPMLDEGAHIEADVRKCTPRNEAAIEKESSKFEMSDSAVGADELCYFLDLNKPEVSLVNNKIGKKFTVSYCGETLPDFLEWKSMASGDYALGLEPCTTKLDDNFKYSKIKSGEKIRFFVELKVSAI